MHKRTLLINLVILSALIALIVPQIHADEKQADSNDSRVIAEVGDEKILFGDLNNLIRMMPPSYQAMFSNPDQINKLLERQIDNMLFAQEARRLKVDENPDVKYKLEEFTKGILTQALIEETVNKKVTVTDKEIEEYHNNNISEFEVPEKIKVSHILIAFDSNAGEDAKAEKKKQAEQILYTAKAGENFAELAQQFSDDAATKKRGGVLGFFPRGSKSSEIEEVAFNLKKDEVSDIVLTDKGYHIIKMLDKKEG
ncbi:MAG: peptidylprolyl isomerase, partial [Thermodesulfobacteriota bacterium]|nr:peptidylprolyl isomerase [Thermodesulfobacteriota bacterium]